MISDQGGDEGRLSTYHLNRFGAEEGWGVKFSLTPAHPHPPPPTPGTAVFALTKLQGEQESGNML